MKAKWKISPIPQSPNPNQRPQLRSGPLVPVARTAGPGVRCERRELFGFGLQAMLATALVSAFGRGHGAPRERLYGPRAARSSLKSSSSTHATSLYGARCYGGVRARASATPCRSSGRERKFCGCGFQATKARVRFVRRAYPPCQRHRDAGVALARARTPPQHLAPYSEVA